LYIPCISELFVTKTKTQNNSFSFSFHISLKQRLLAREEGVREYAMYCEWERYEDEAEGGGALIGSSAKNANISRFAILDSL